MNDFLKQLDSLQDEAPESREIVDTGKPQKEAYFQQYDYVSNSGLKAMQKARLGKPDTPDFVFTKGSMIDCYLLEPYKFNAAYPDVTLFEMLQLIRCKAALSGAYVLPYDYDDWHKQCLLTGKYKALNGVKFQAERYREKFPVDDVFVKARIKMDLVLKSPNSKKHIIDLKSTTKHNEAQFRRDISTYDLDMQAAYYCDVHRAENFTLVIVPYVSEMQLEKASSGSIEYIDAIINKPKVWVIDMRPYLSSGREKYKKLIKEGIEAGQIKTV